MPLVLHMLEFRKQHSAKKCDEFAAKFAESPFHAIDNCDSVFEAAAELEIVDQCIVGLKVAEEKDLMPTCVNKLLSFYEGEMLSAAKWPTKSTSDTVNLAARYRLAAIANVVELLRAEVKGE